MDQYRGAKAACSVPVSPLRGCGVVRRPFLALEGLPRSEPGISIPRRQVCRDRWLGGGV